MNGHTSPIRGWRIGVNVEGLVSVKKSDNREGSSRIGLSLKVIVGDG